jgi:Double zinc ribbon
MTAVTACRSCGTEVVEDARFCHGCGSAVAAAADAHAEYEQVTVLFADVYLARESARCGDCDEAIPVMRAAIDQLFRERRRLGWSTIITGVLVDTLLDRGTDSDVAEAEAAIERLAAAPTDDGVALRDIWLLRLRALLARARGEGVKYLDFVNRYRDMATSLGFEGHIAWAEAMP